MDFGSLMTTNPNTHRNFSQTGQAATYLELERLIYAFEEVLKRLGIPIQAGSELEKACCSVLEMLGKSQDVHICDPQEDIRHKFREVLGIGYSFGKIVRLKDHACFPKFAPHLALLNKGTVGQNTRASLCQEATNKIFELLFALALLDISNDVILDHPSSAKGDNPDVLATIDGQCWGFACKTIEAEYRNGAEPIFSAYELPADFVASHVSEVVTQKHDQIVAEIGLPNIMKLFAGKKALPGYLAYCPTCTGRDTAQGPVPRSINMLGVGEFGNLQAHQGIIEKINSALHECSRQ